MYERIKEDAGRNLSAFTDDDHSRKTLYRWIAIGSAVNILSWIIAILTPKAIAEWIGLAFDLDISGKLQMWLLAIPFWFTFFATYSFLRLPRYSNVTATLADDDVMASFRDAERSNYVRNRVLLALAVSAANTILLVFAALTLR
jgi:hypothetical protein